jgi:D-alanyl-D-alanine carboxypeptidase (penicillin-binding protein 5/6)
MLRRLVLYLFLSSSCAYAKLLDLELNADKAILINAKTGHVLFEKKADQPAFPASTTKIATALYVLEKCENIEEIVTVKKEALASITPQAKKDSNYRSPPYWLETDGTQIGLRSGEELPVKDLLYGALLSSGNDACNTLAIYSCGTIARFMTELNAFLCQIGCHHTHFLNPHGLHHPQHLTTARDLATMAKYGLKKPLFREIVKTVKYQSAPSNLQSERTFVQTNMFLRKGTYHDPRVIGVKTGTTQAAGSGLVCAAKDGDRELISVVLGCKNRSEVLQDTKKMFDVAFAQPLMRYTYLEPGPTPLKRSVKGTSTPLKTVIHQALTYDFYEAEQVLVKPQVHWYELKLPIKTGQEVGYVALVAENEQVLSKVSLYAESDVRRSLWALMLVMPVAGFLILGLFVLIRRA